MNQIDLIQSDTPFHPQKTNPDGTAQIPPELQLGTQTQQNVPVYQDSSTGVVVTGTLTTTVTDISSTYTQAGLTFPLTTYQAVVTLTYTYLNRNYSFSMSTIRTSDYMRLTSNDRGYTLVEFAVGAAMIGVIGLLLYSVLNLCIVLGAKNAAINVAHQNARTAMTRMLRDLRLPAPALVLPAIPPSTRRLSQVLFRLRPQEGTVPIAAAQRTSLVFWKIGRMLPSLIMGPMVELYQSAQSTGEWGKANVYSPPTRQWYFDNNFKTKPPPGSLMVYSYVKGRWYVL